MACVELDVSEHASIQRAVADALREFSRIDILVNNAGCNIRKPATEVTWDDWNEIVDTNLRGAFFVAQAAAWQMIPRRLRADHQHRLGDVRRRLRGPGAVRREPRRHQANDDEPRRTIGARTASPSIASRRAGSRRRRTRSSTTTRGGSTTSPNGFRSAGRAKPDDLDGASSVLASDASATSPGRRCWWTAGFRSARCGRCRNKNRAGTIPPANSVENAR